MFFSFKDVNLKTLAEFYGTLLIPLYYFFNLYIIFKFKETIEFPLWLVLVGLVFTYVGMFLWVISYLQLGRAFGVLPNKQKRVTKGLYGTLKHPMYLAIILTFSGLSLAIKSSVGFYLTSFVTFPILVLRACLEDIRLK